MEEINLLAAIIAIISNLFVVCALVGLFFPQKILAFAHKSKRTRFRAVWFYFFLSLVFSAVYGIEFLQNHPVMHWIFVLAPSAALVAWLVMLRHPAEAGGEGGRDIHTLIAQAWRERRKSKNTENA